MTMTLRIETSRAQFPMPVHPFHRWMLADGTLWTEFFRTEDGYVLRFPDLADFAIAPDALAVTCFPTPGIPEATSQHLYLNQVLPLALSKQGKLVFHASAVEIDSGAVVLAGVSGRGKSTLAASMAIGGHPFLTDDGLVVEFRAGAHVAIPSHPSIRLWNDSEAALIAPGTRAAAAVSFTPKSRFLAGASLPFCAVPRPIRRVYFLGDGTATDIDFRRMSGSEAMIEWVRHSFLLDVEEKSRLTSHFDQVARLANEGIHYSLDYPRRYEDLARVRHAIVDHARA